MGAERRLMYRIETLRLEVNFSLNVLARLPVLNRKMISKTEKDGAVSEVIGETLFGLVSNE